MVLPQFKRVTIYWKGLWIFVAIVASPTAALLAKGTILLGPDDVASVLATVSGAVPMTMLMTFVAWVFWNIVFYAVKGVVWLYNLLPDYSNQASHS